MDAARTTQASPAACAASPHYPSLPCGRHTHPLLLTDCQQGHLDAALRASSAAGEDPELLRRVDVRLPPGKALEGDRGWDVFSLQYIVDGPLGAVLSPDAMAGALVGAGRAVEWRLICSAGPGFGRLGRSTLRAALARRPTSLAHRSAPTNAPPQATCASSGCCGPSSTWRLCWGSAGTVSTGRSAGWPRCGRRRSCTAWAWIMPTW